MYIFTALCSLVAFESLLVDSIVESVRAATEVSVRRMVRQALSNEEAERQCLLLENEALRQRVAELSCELQVHSGNVASDDSFLSSLRLAQ